MSRSVYFPWHDLDLEKAGPQLACHKQAITSGVVCDAVQHGLGVVEPVHRRQQAAQVYPAEDSSRLWRDPGDAVGVPYVCVHLATHELQLVEVTDRSPAVGDRNPPDLPKRLGIEKPQLIGAITEDEPSLIVGETPSLPHVAEGATWSKAEEIVDKRHVGLPRQLHELPFPISQSFGEVGLIDRTLLNDFSGLRLHLAQARSTTQARALVEEAVSINQPLRVRRRVMRVGIDDTIGVDRRRALRREARGGSGNQPARDAYQDTTANAGRSGPGIIDLRSACRRILDERAHSLEYFRGDDSAVAVGVEPDPTVCRGLPQVALPHARQQRKVTLVLVTIGCLPLR